MRLQALDLFRFFAAIFVVLYHYTARADHNYLPQLAQFTQFGWMGVPLFFMISGFVISVSADKRTPTTFLISRATRLYPAFWIGVTLTSLCLIVFEHKQISAKQYLANLTMLNDYIGIRNIDGVYWTLQAELKFYGCIFLLLCARAFSKFEIWVSIWLIFTIMFACIQQPFFMPWLISPDYSPFFISGVAAFLIYSRGPSKFSVITLMVSTLLSAFYTYQQAAGFMPLATAADKWIASGITLSFHLLFVLLALKKLKVPNLKIFATLGGITYPIYLIHNHLGKGLVDSFESLNSKMLALGITFIAILFFSYIIFKYIEPPIANRLKQILEKLTNQKALKPQIND